MLAGHANACYNDSDTYLTELRDNLDVTNAIIGRFTIYPPEYYEKRIQIQKAILAKDPNNLDAYDNISVAYDRVGRGNDAIRWIEEKRKHLGMNSGNHLYTTEANEGTFYIVRWLRGHKEGDLTDAQKAEKYVEKALEYNPNGHFGREFSQLYCIRAILQCGAKSDWETHFTASLLQVADKEHIDRKKLRYGIAGMMVLGAAWNSPMFIQAVGQLVPEEPQIGNLCKEKLRFLQGHTIGDSEADLTEKYPIHVERAFHGAVDGVVDMLLRNGVDFQASQEAFVQTRLKQGKHTDTDKDFWNGYEPTPPVPTQTWASSTVFSRAWTYILNDFIMGGGCCLLIPVGIVFLVVRSIVRQRLRKV